MRLKIMAAGGAKREDTPVDARAVHFVDAESGRVVFAVKAGEDGLSIEIRGVDTVFVDGQAFGNRIAVHPDASNAATVSARPYYDLPVSKLTGTNLPEGAPDNPHNRSIVPTDSAQTRANAGE